MSFRHAVVSLILAFFLLCFAVPAYADTLYSVKPGDSLYLIGQKYGSTASEIKNANYFAGYTIYPGQILQLPVSGLTYRVQPGDSLFSIATKYDLTVNSIRSANNFWNATLYAGQVLWIPTAKANEALSKNMYRVQPGDTLYYITKKLGVTTEALKKANGLVQDQIYAGQLLAIPTTNSTYNVTYNNRISSPTSSRASNSISSRSSNNASKDLELLARLVYGEARGEPYIGQVAVAAVVLNRVKNSKFPNSISGVIFEPWAFDAVYNGQFNQEPSASAYKAAQDALQSWDPSGGALYYWNPAKATSRWVWSRPIINQLGNHVFAY